MAILILKHLLLKPVTLALKVLSLQQHPFERGRVGCFTSLALLEPVTESIILAPMVILSAATGDVDTTESLGRLNPADAKARSSSLAPQRLCLPPLAATETI